MTPDVSAALITTIGGVLVALLGVLAEGLRRYHKAFTEVRENTLAAREQVQNSHSTNLRDDIDELAKAIEHLIGLQHGQTKDIAGLRSEVRLEREERLDVARRLDAHLNRNI